jgi:glycosyltransferase involved in cell wall biosynthesis
MKPPPPVAQPAPRLAVVLSHATQYYSPWFRWMKAHSDLEFRVFYLSDFGITPVLDEKFGTRFAWDTDLTTGYDWEVVPNKSKKPDVLRFNGLKNPELFPRLRTWRPDSVLLFGYNYNTHLRLIFRARSARLPLIFRGDSHLLGRTHLPFPKRFLLRQLYRNFSSITYVGKSNVDYFKRLGVQGDRLFFAPHAVDSSHFSPTEARHVARATETRARLGLSPDTRVVLFAGKLIPSKQPHALLESFLQLNHPNTALLFVGDGEEKSSLQARAAARPEAPVHFLPFANQSEMPGLYLASDLFVLPSQGSYETWGLSVNEAMHMGVPCLVSDLVGCQVDLVSDRETGWVFKADRPEHLRAKLLEALCALEKDRQGLRSAVLTRISGYTYEQATAGLKNAFAHALKT